MDTIVHASKTRLSTRRRKKQQGTPIEECESYATVARDLVTKGGRTKRDTRLCITYLWNFAMRYDVSGEGRLDVIEGSQSGCARAIVVWDTMCLTSKWSTCYKRTVQRLLAHALWYVVQAVAVAIDPAIRRHAYGLGPHQTIHTTHRIPTDQLPFTVHSVLPCPVRKLPDHHLRYSTLVNLVLGIVPHLRAVSKACLQRTARMLDRVLCAAHWDTDPWHTLTERTLEDWLHAYKLAHPSPASIGFPLFKREMRVLSIVYEHVLGHHGLNATLPIPRSASSNAYGITNTPFGSSSSSSERGDTQSAERLRIRVTMGDMRRTLCRVSQDNATLSEVQTAFTPNEIDRILKAAASTTERLVVALLLSTGLRIGGVARIRLPFELPNGTIQHGRDTPTTLVTLEKGNRSRTVQLSHSVRILLAHWWQGERKSICSSTNTYVFPGRGGVGHGTTRMVWTVCRRIFDRAGVTGSHVHPHTIRHTVVHLLYLAGGMSFEQIAKWLGHSNPTLTSSVYGRIQSRELHSMVPFADAVVADEVRSQWKHLAQRIQYPFAFPYEDWSGLSPPPWLRTPVTTASIIETPQTDRSSIIQELRKLARNLEHMESSPSVESIDIGSVMPIPNHATNFQTAQSLSTE
jgi:hypothetical protein